MAQYFPRFNEKGFLQTGWLKEGDNWYYLDAKTGAMSANKTTPDAKPQ